MSHLMPNELEITKHLVILDRTGDEPPVDMGVLYIDQERIRWCANKRVILEMTWEQWALATTQALGGALNAQSQPT